MSGIARVVGIIIVIGIFAVGCSTDNNPTSSTMADNTTLNRAPVDSGIAALGDYVWFDENMDGIQGDPLTEPGIEGAKVYLLTCAGDVLDSTVTDEEGFYCFQDLTFGDSALSYALQFVFPEDDEFGPKTDEVTPYLPIWLGTAGGAESFEVTDDTTAYEVLCQNVYGKPNNGITKLYAQLLAAKLNIADGADPADIQATVDAADAFLADYSWEDWNGLDKDLKDSVNTWKDLLDDYNNGIIGPGHCQNEWFFSEPDQGGDDALDSDADPATGLTGCTSFVDPIFDDTWDAGMYLVIDEGCTHSKGYWKNHIFVD